MKTQLKKVEYGVFTYTIYQRSDLTRFPNHPFSLERVKATPKGRIKEKTEFHYVYKSLEECENKIEAELTSIKARNERKQVEKDKVKDMQKDLRAKDYYSVGDIVVNSWGYDQTNIEYYQVMGMTEKTIIVREIRQEIVNTDGISSMAAYVMPCKGEFCGYEFTLKLKLWEWSGKIECAIRNPKSYYYFHKWNGTKEYSSWYA